MFGQEENNRSFTHVSSSSSALNWRSYAFAATTQQSRNGDAKEPESLSQP